ncbi:MAG: extracellular solute-binding protein, partial [Candidatus Bathyarchaeia archaeon]
IVVSLLVSAGNMVFLNMLMGVPARMEAIEARLRSMEDKLLAGELFPGETELYMKAKEEGALIVYTVWDVEDIVKLLAEFSKRYPGISTTYWQAKNPDIVARVLSEYEAGQASVDVIASDSAPPVLKPYGAIKSYTTVQLKELLVQDPDMPVVNLQVQVLAYNSQVLKSLGIPPPSTWEDVINPIYKGLVALDDPLRAGPGSHVLVMLREYWKNDTKWENFIRGLKALEVPVHQSTSAMMRLVVAGEYAIGFPLLSHDVIREQQKGSPIEIVKTVDPITVFPRYAAIYANAPHPNAAKLFAEWLCSIEGQLVFAELMRTPSRRGVPSSVSIDAIYGAGATYVLPSMEYMQNTKGYVDAYIKPIWTG